jgi:ribosomal protein L7/L12
MVTLNLVFDTHEALHDHFRLRRELTETLVCQLAKAPETTWLNVAIQVYRLAPTEKVKGIKILRDALRLSLRDARVLWEVAQTLA